MKSLLLFLGPLLTLFSTCGSADSSFDFDAADYYKLQESSEYVSYYVQNSTAADSLRNAVIEGTAPQSLSDSGLLASLSEMGFTSNPIAAERLPELRKIFGANPPRDSERWNAACTPMYRDILVFRRSGRIMAVAKICFHCRQAVLLSSPAVRENFEAYEALSKVLSD